MTNFKIFSDSACDLEKQYLDKYDIGIIPYYVSFDNTEYLKENIDIDIETFYNKFSSNNTSPKTSLPSIVDYTEAFRPHLDKGEDIICICLSSKLSGSFQSAQNAALLILEEYPNRNIVIIDSLQATGSQGIMVLQCAYMRDEGYSLEDTVNKLRDIALSSGVVFTIDNLEHLQRGGRIGKAAALAGTLLNIKPIIKLENGELIPISKARGRKKALSEVVKNTFEIIDNKDNYDFGFIKYSYPEDADFLRSTLNNDYDIETPYPNFNLGVTIGTHSGPTAVGIVYVKKYNK